MHSAFLNKLCGSLASAALVLALAGCNGGGGGGGTTAPTPPPATGPTVDAASLTTDQWAALQAQVTVTKVTMGGAPVVDFTVKDSEGNGLKGLGFTTQSILPDRSGNYAIMPSLSNLAFSIAKLIPEDGVTKAPSKWVNYIVTSVPTQKADATPVPTAPTTPTTDATGTLVDHGDGTYTYTFYRNIATTQTFLDNYAGYTSTKIKTDLGNVTYEPTRTHRLTIQFSGNARGTGSNTANGVTVATAVAMANPVNAIYDFIPSTGAVSTNQREVANIAKCNECHDKLSFHGGGRVELQYCVVCHTDQRKYGYAVASAGTTTTYTGSTNKFALDATTTTAAGDMPALVHRIHMGTQLANTGYNYANVKFDTIGYSMLDGGQRMCSKCHSGASSDPKATAQGENWNLKPTRQACGTCHDDVNFATGAIGSTPAAHIVQNDDTGCASCHVGSGNSADIKIAHQTQNLTPHNPVTSTGLMNFKYEIASATVDGTGAATIKFRILGNANATPTTPVTLLTATTPMANPLAGFTGAPSFLLAWAMPQEGLTTPADFNNLATANGAPVSTNFQPRSISIANLLDTAKSATDGTMTGPDASGYYTANIVAAKGFPVGATMRTVALQGYFTQVAGTWDSNADGVVNGSDTATAARHTIAVVKTVTGDTARRTVIDNTKCANCHEWFEGHGGNRVYEIQVCTMCHVPSLTTSGKGMPDARLAAWWDYYWSPTSTVGDRHAAAREVALLNKWTTNTTYPSGIDFTVNPVSTTGLTNVALNFPQTTNNLKDMIHGIHAGKDRTNPIMIVRDRTNATTANGAVNIIGGEAIGFPGIRNNCTDCHTYNGYSGAPASTLATREQAINTAGNTTVALASAALATANTTDLMTTPFTASCVSCHDTTAGKAHMTLNGGQIQVARSSLNSAGESCAVCHGAGSTYDPVVVHK